MLYYIRLIYTALLYILLSSSLGSFLSNLDLVLHPNNIICDKWGGIENDTDEDEYEEMLERMLVTKQEGLIFMTM